MTTFKWEGKYIVWAEMSESYIAHIEAENAKEAEEKARQLPLESWELVDGHGDIKLTKLFRSNKTKSGTADKVILICKTGKRGSKAIT